MPLAFSTVKGPKFVQRRRPILKLCWNAKAQQPTSAWQLGGCAGAVQSFDKDEPRQKSKEIYAGARATNRGSACRNVKEVEILPEKH